MARRGPVAITTLLGLAPGVEYKRPEGHPEWFRILEIGPVGDDEILSDSRLAKVVKLGGRQAGQEYTVRLYPYERGYTCLASTLG